MTRRFRFGVVNETVLSGRKWIDHVRRIEESRIDVFLIRDHISADALGQQWAPFSALAIAAASTTSLRVGTMVLANDFRHPAVVAQEAATLAALSGGRFELGIGAGWYEPEFRAAGLPFDRPPIRIGRLEESVQIIKSLLNGDAVDFSGRYYTVKGLSLGFRPGYVPLQIGGGGRKMLSLAARFADIVGILPAPIRSADDDDVATNRSRASFAEKIEVLRSEAGTERFPQLELCAVVTMRIAGKKRDATERLIAERGWTGVTPEEVWTMPTVFIGSLAEIRDLLHERRERLGLTYFVSSDDDLDVLHRVIERL